VKTSRHASRTSVGLPARHQPFTARDLAVESALFRKVTAVQSPPNLRERAPRHFPQIMVSALAIGVRSRIVPILRCDAWAKRRVVHPRHARHPRQSLLADHARRLSPARRARCRLAPRYAPRGPSTHAAVARTSGKTLPGVNDLRRAVGRVDRPATVRARVGGGDSGGPALARPIET